MFLSLHQLAYDVSVYIRHFWIWAVAGQAFGFLCTHMYVYTYIISYRGMLYELYILVYIS